MSDMEKKLDLSLYTAFVFDFDLTLVDSSEAIIDCFMYTFEKAGLKIPDEDDIFRTIGLPLTKSFDVLAGRPLGEKKKELREIYCQRADKIMAKMSRFYPGVIGALCGLRKRGKRTAIVSSKMRFRIEETFVAQTDEFPIDIIIGHGEAGEPKPAPDGIVKAARLLCAELSDVLYIGDSYIDAETAQNACVDFAAVTSGSTTAEEFKKYPHILVAGSVAEIFGGEL